MTSGHVSYRPGSVGRVGTGRVMKPARGSTTANDVITAAEQPDVAWALGTSKSSALTWGSGWARQASNLRPADYESAALTD